MGGLSARQLFTVILSAIISADIISVLVFMFSRQDPNLRVAALVGTSNIAVAYVAIASTLLTGKDLAHPQPGDQPPGSVVTVTNTVQLPPITPPSA